MTTKANKPEDFGRQLAELEAIAAALENGDVDLEHGLQQFKRGMELVTTLKARLQEVENQVKLVKRQYEVQPAADSRPDEPEPEPEAQPKAGADPGMLF